MDSAIHSEVLCDLRAPASVDHEHRTGDERGRIRSEKQRCPGDLVGDGVAAERRLAEDVLVDLGGLDEVARKAGFDEARSDGVDTDPDRPELAREGLWSM